MGNALEAVKEREFPVAVSVSRPVVLTQQEYAELVALRDEVQGLKMQLQSARQPQPVVEAGPRVNSFFD